MSQGGQGQSPMGGYGRPQYGFGGNYGGGYQAPNYGSRMGAPMMAFKSQPNYTLGAGSPRYAQDPNNPDAVNLTGFGKPQMSGEFMAGPPKGGLLAAPQDQAPGFMVNQRMQAPQQAPQQSFEQFASTLANSGMTSGQMQDAYQKSLQPAATNFWGNVGPGGTQNPYPQNPNWTPPQWGQQTFGFDPRSMAGKTVSKDLGWYYGQDAIGRQINNQGDAVPTFTPAQDGFNRTNPAWFR